MHPDIIVLPLIRILILLQLLEVAPFADNIMLVLLSFMLISSLSCKSSASMAWHLHVFLQDVSSIGGVPGICSKRRHSVAVHMLYVHIVRRHLLALRVVISTPWARAWLSRSQILVCTGILHHVGSVPHSVSLRRPATV